ncbi:haloalkane dehalogenase [Cladophialophora psammophila CBS 110553]|uniref:Haloalkane dehalogenase n=1 Tax=Cladophialophora psammophila CBS 110553 TaxID=1182543 RepID=W9X4Z8_9EURO|nr:haloalkane dehalogenase [Cladophialophora psammophila CBS 110553]EXJ75582.1 haloalkane dehalogenase [Cladophialophora psammophila CBS 110553]
MYTTLPNGIKVFYREAGSSSNHTILLLHGFPSSSNQYRNLIPILSKKYHVVAPDLPGFGFTEIPASLKFQYTFANLATTIGSFLDILKIQKFAVYVFDYGAPTGFRLALERPEAITAIISQNGNAYVEGLSSFWDPLRQLWASDAGSDEEKQLCDMISGAVLSFDATKGQYLNGEPEAEKIDDPATYHLDYALMCRPGNKEIQLDLFRDYATNVALYPKFQAYLREGGVPVLAVWGKNDTIFPPVGAEAFRRDVKELKLVLLDGGHFLVESHTEEVGKLILEFLAERGL